MRRSDREVTDINSILEIVGRAKILHLGLFDKGFPYIVPMHFGYEFNDGRFVFFLHSAKEGHKLDLIKDNPNVCIEMECDVNLISGGEVPCKYGSEYASVIGRGHAELVGDEEEKIKGLKLLMKNQTGRSFEIDSKMAESVEVIKVVISDLSAKARRKS
ncbi:MAG: pyridoxamine 5'-phosphate oxidase family protein [Spirochaetales bacterium]|nr:pyridoxamine 5'-phosphate oxidase family protein [Spirochaetales bacterium]